MTQLDLNAPPRMQTHEENLERVGNRIAESVLSFCRIEILYKSQSFHMNQLAQCVEQGMGRYIAPDSAGRILRDLKQKGLIGYTLLSRKNSHYRIDWVRQ